MLFPIKLSRQICDRTPLSAHSKTLRKHVTVAEKCFKSFSQCLKKSYEIGNCLSDEYCA